MTLGEQTVLLSINSITIVLLSVKKLRIMHTCKKWKNRWYMVGCPSPLNPVLHYL